jgi:hypothetical protein
MLRIAKSETHGAGEKFPQSREGSGRGGNLQLEGVLATE